MLTGRRPFGGIKRKLMSGTGLLPVRKILQIDTQLRALLVKMAALQAQRLGSLGGMPTMPLKFRQHSLTLESKYALRQRPCRFSFRAGADQAAARCRQGHAHILRI